MPPTPTLLVNLLAQPKILWAIFVVVFALFVIISIILNYHWRAYGLYQSTVTVVMVVYYLVSILLLITMTSILLG